MCDELSTRVFHWQPARGVFNLFAGCHEDMHKLLLFLWLATSDGKDDLRNGRRHDANAADRKKEPDNKRYGNEVFTVYRVQSSPVQEEDR